MAAKSDTARRAVADTARAVSEEVRESFRAWVERNFLDARARGRPIGSDAIPGAS